MTPKQLIWKLTMTHFLAAVWMEENTLRNDLQNSKVGPSAYEWQSVLVCLHCNGLFPPQTRYIKYLCPTPGLRDANIALFYTESHKTSPLSIKLSSGVGVGGRTSAARFVSYFLGLGEKVGGMFCFPSLRVCNIVWEEHQTRGPSRAAKDLATKLQSPPLLPQSQTS